MPTKSLTKEEQLVITWTLSHGW